jgi:signal transduction histidine kinase
MEPAEGVSLVVECLEELAMLSNRDLVEQAVSNLVRNSVKHTSRGSIRIAAHGADGYVEISVADTGVGIAEEALPRVFDRFYRSDSSHEGFGLGLAIVHASAEVLGGEMGIESTPGEGTTVRMRLPTGATLVGPLR